MACARDPSGRGRIAGFTLLEVVVALIIVSLGFVALLRGGAGGLHSVSVAAQTEQAVALAEARLAAFGAAGDPGAVDWQGDEGRGFHWRLHATPEGSVALSGPLSQLVAQTTLYRVAVTVSWQNGARPASVSLETQRLTKLPANGP